MYYRLIRFGTVNLPTAEAEIAWVTPKPDLAILQLPGGGYFDQGGTLTADRRYPAEQSFKGEVVEADRYVMRTTLDALAALSGQRAKLYREGIDDAREQWCYARCVEVRGTRTWENQTWQEVEIDFLLLTPWHDLELKTLTIDLSGTEVTTVVQNYGNTYFVDAILTVTAATAAITALTVSTDTGISWTFSGSILVGTSLVVDSGLRSVLNDGADAYASFVRNAGHTRDEFLRFRAGDTDLTIAWTGGGSGSAAVLAWYDTSQ